MPDNGNTINPNALSRRQAAELLNRSQTVAHRRQAGFTESKAKICTQSTVTNWTESGLPTRADGKISLVEIAAWLASRLKDRTRDAGPDDLERLTRAQLCGICGVSKQSVSRWIEDGCPMATKTQLSLKDVARYLSEKIKRVTNESGGDGPSQSDVDAEYRSLQEELGLGEDEMLPDELDPYLKQGQSYYQELGRKRAAELALVKLRRERGALLPLDELQEEAALAGAVLRQELDQVARRHPTVAAELETALEAARDRLGVMRELAPDTAAPPEDAQ